MLRLILAPIVILVVGAGWAQARSLGIFGGETVEIGEGKVSINGVDNEATASKVVALRTDSPLGELVVQTYDSKLGACYDLVFEDGRREAQCLAASGITPDQEVTGNPTTGSIEGLNGPAWNSGLTESGIGMLHYGIAHPSISKVQLEPSDGGEAIEAKLADAPNIPDLKVYVVWTPPGMDHYRLAGYDDNGCMVDSSLYSVTGGIPGLPGAENGC